MAPDQNPTLPDSPYTELWRTVFEHVQREAEAGNGPWLLTEDGRTWIASRERNTRA